MSRQSLHNFKVYLLNFAKNPIFAIQIIPEFEWKILFGTFLLCSVSSGVLNALIAGSWSSVITSLIILPITSIVVLFIVTAFFYYCFLFVLKAEVNPKQLLPIVVFSSFPFLLIHPLTPMVPPADLVGLAFSSLLFVVGAVSHFDLPKKRVSQLVLGVYVLFFLGWIAATIENNSRENSFLPSDEEQLEKMHFEIRKADSPNAVENEED